eukprot:TRINITY_DN16636_c0_g1_i1.p3 TRINITY_DN16636_c0_g1~~TRINITY_DN16636_c0_g1_i1.p3  ORF type:complete len:187 (-),score=44.65 TRINITY_DN16636_c0_g1_i1:308-844(-)
MTSNSAVAAAEAALEETSMCLTSVMQRYRRVDFMPSVDTLTDMLILFLREAAINKRVPWLSITPHLLVHGPELSITFQYPGAPFTVLLYVRQDRVSAADCFRRTDVRENQQLEALLSTAPVAGSALIGILNYRMNVPEPHVEVFTIEDVLKGAAFGEELRGLATWERLFVFEEDAQEF